MTSMYYEMGTMFLCLAFATIGIFMCILKQCVPSPDDESQNSSDRAVVTYYIRHLTEGMFNKPEESAGETESLNDEVSYATCKDFECAHSNDEILDEIAMKEMQTRK